MRAFLDTNVLVYLFDGGSPAKQRRAQQLFERVAYAGEALLSTQVLQEFYVAVTRKLSKPLAPELAYRVVQDLALLPLVQIDSQLVLGAIERSQREQLAYWDALIVQAAVEGGADMLFSEGLQHGQQFGALTVQNPFLGRSGG